MSASNTKNIEKAALNLVIEKIKGDDKLTENQKEFEIEFAQCGYRFREWQLRKDSTPHEDIYDFIRQESKSNLALALSILMSSLYKEVNNIQSIKDVVREMVLKSNAESVDA